MKRSIVFSLTGAMGSGKSTIANIFATHGVAVVDADLIARAVVLPGSEGLNALVERFGIGVLDGKKRLDRKKLGSLVFNDPGSLQALNHLLHPRIHQESRRQFIRHQKAGHSVICYDIPLLFETRQEKEYSPVVVVFASEEQRIQRVKLRDNLSTEEIKQRFLAQIPLQEKVQKATYVIDNNGSRQVAEASALKVLEKVKEILKRD